LEGDDAVAPDQIFDIGLLGPAVGFVGFQFKFYDGSDRIIGRQDFGIGGVELVRGELGTSESAVLFC
jgi:hypothetical protein